MKQKTGRKAHEPDDIQKQTVQLHATIGTRHENIARLLKIDVKTLYKYYRDELDLGLDKANATVGGALFKKAKGGDTSAMIFWMKTRAGWRERPEAETNVTVNLPFDGWIIERAHKPD